jgi:ADP-ribose pyrophosphatase YjhB (NUDIX family)
MKNPQWLQWAQRLQAIAQNGLTYAKDPFDLERFNQIRQIAAEILVSSDDPNAVDSVIDLFKKNFGYATPKVDVRAAVFDNNRILLGKERVDNAWTLPGGWADIGDAPSVAALREVREESGYEAKVEKLAAVYDHNLHDHPPYPFHSYKLFFVCTLTGGAPSLSVETTAVDFFSESAIPLLSLPRVTPTQIQHMFDHSPPPRVAHFLRLTNTA